QGLVDEAQKIIDSLPSKTIRTDPARASRVLNSLGEAHVRSQQWQAAISNFQILIELEPSNHLVFHGLSPLLVQTGDVRAYRQLCQTALARFAGTRDPSVADRMAKDCLILPDAGVDLTAIDEWADTATTSHRAGVAMMYFQCTKGLAEYRL